MRLAGLARPPAELACQLALPAQHPWVRHPLAPDWSRANRSVMAPLVRGLRVTREVQALQAGPGSAPREARRVAAMSLAPQERLARLLTGRRVPVAALAFGADAAQSWGPREVRAESPAPRRSRAPKFR